MFPVNECVSRQRELLCWALIVSALTALPGSRELLFGRVEFGAPPNNHDPS